MTWQEIIAKLEEALKGLSGDERTTTLAAIAAGLPQDVRQIVYNEGHGAAKKTYDGKIQTLESERDAARSEATTAQDQLKKEQKKAPDVDAVRRELEQKLADAEAKRLKEVADVTEKLGQSRLDAYRDGVIAELVGLGVDPLIARYQVQEVTGKRFKLDGEEIKTYTADGATPLAVPEGKTASGILAGELVKGIDARYIKSTTTTGAGESIGGGPGTNAGYYDSLRKEASQQPVQDKALDDLVGIPA